MTLRLRLFLLFGGLLVAVVLGGGWWVRSLTDDLSAELGEVALWVGKAVFETIGQENFSGSPEDSGASPSAVGQQVHVMAFRGAGDDGSPRILERLGGDLTPHEGDGATHGFRYEVRCENDACVERRMERIGGPEDDHLLALSLDRVADELFLSVVSDDQQRTIPVPRQGVDRALQRFSRRFFVGSLGLLSIGLLGAAVVAHRATSPLRRLGEAAREVGSGAFGTEVAVAGSGEVGEAIRAFNAMSSRLRELDEDARRLRQGQHLTELGEVARGLAHSLRNPLNAMGLSIDELASRAADAEGAGELASGARRQIRRVDLALRSFLALASQGGGVLEEIDLLALSRDVALEALQDAQGRVGIEVEEPAEPVAVWGVAAELRAVLQALVVNAVEASSAGGRVELRWSPAGERVTLEVADRGGGIAPEVRKRLFTPHVTTKATGSGMGLFLAQRISAHRYRGSLTLEDRPGGGTVARLALRSRDRQDD